MRWACVDLGEVLDRTAMAQQFQHGGEMAGGDCGRGRIRSLHAYSLTCVDLFLQKDPSILQIPTRSPNSTLAPPPHRPAPNAVSFLPLYPHRDTPLPAARHMRLLHVRTQVATPPTPPLQIRTHPSSLNRTPRSSSSCTVADPKGASALP